jgi:hypothetical protein
MITARLACLCALLPGIAFADAPKELTDLASALAGTWKCTGTASDDGKRTEKVKVTIDSKLDGMWLQTTWTGLGMDWTIYATYNAPEQLFQRYVMSPRGDSADMWAATADIASSPGMVWTGGLHRARMAKPPIVPTGEPTAADKKVIEDARVANDRWSRGMPIKVTERVDADGYSIRFQGSLDHGKTYVKLLDLTCNK